MKLVNKLIISKFWLNYLGVHQILHEQLFHVEHDQKEQLSIELNGVWLSPEAAIAKGIPTAMKKLITAKQKTSST